MKIKLPTGWHYPSIPLTCIWLMILLMAAQAAAQPMLRNGKRPGFQQPKVNISTNYDRQGEPRASIHVSIPQKSMIFRTDDEAFRSEMRVTVLAMRKGKRIGGALNTAAARASSFQATRNRGFMDCQVFMPLPDMKPIDLVVITEIVGTTRRWEQKFKYNPSEGSRIPWYFEDVVSNIDPERGDRFLGGDIDSLKIHAQLGFHPVRAGAVKGTTSLVFALVDEEGRQKFLHRLNLPGRGDRERLSLDVAFAAESLPFGDLNLSLRIVQTGVDSLSLNPPLQFLNMHVDLRNDQVWRRQISWLEGPDGSDDLDAMKKAPPEDRQRLWEEFWSLAGGNEARITHLLRILEADDRFGGFGRGALSDMGRVFIKFGTPDSVESRENNISSPSVWKIWNYYELGTSFIFYDAYGMGDFRLYSRAPI
jgi:GWxTD domain-containing protein